jgi:hypothetical protein
VNRIARALRRCPDRLTSTSRRSRAGAGKYLTFVDVGLRREFDRILEGYQPFDFHVYLPKGHTKYIGVRPSAGGCGNRRPLRPTLPWRNWRGANERIRRGLPTSHFRPNAQRESTEGRCKSSVCRSCPIKVANPGRIPLVLLWSRPLVNGNSPSLSEQTTFGHCKAIVVSGFEGARLRPAIRPGLSLRPRRRGSGKTLRRRGRRWAGLNPPRPRGLRL